MRFLLIALSLAVMAFGQGFSHGASIVSGPSVEFTKGTQAVIRWSTDVATGLRVFFGESTAHLIRRADGELGASHAVVLPMLGSGTKWFYTVGTARVPLATNSFTVPGGAVHERAPPTTEATSTAQKAESPKKAPPTRETWGYRPSLADHFARHGGDFKAKDADDYARMAWEFQQRARAENLPTKVDTEGVVRIYDPKSGAFAAYNRNGTTRTFFKPGSRDYFERQPGDS